MKGPSVLLGPMAVALGLMACGGSGERPDPAGGAPREGMSATPAAERAPAPGVAVAFPEDSPWTPKVRAADSLVAAWVEAGTLAGAVFQIAVDGAVHRSAHGAAHSRSFGTGQYPTDSGIPGREALEVVTAPRPLSVSDRFDLASVTKVMATTTAVLLLVDRGLLDLEAPVVRWLEDFDDSEPAKARITVRQLLTHTSGLAQWQPVYYHASTADGAWNWIRSWPLEWEVGAERHYSDLGFMTLGRLVERVSGLALDRFVERELYGPLGLHDTGFGGGPAPASARFAATSHGNPFEFRMVHDTAFGYRVPVDPDAWSGWRRYTLEGEVNDGNAFHAFGGVAGHAGLFSTAADLGVLLRLWSEGGRVGDVQLAAPETVARFLTPELPGQALGWQVPERTPEGSFQHTGFTGTWVAGVPELGLRVVLLTNRQHLGVDGEARYPDLGPLQAGVLSALLGSGS